MSSIQCAAITKDNNRCKRNTKNDSKYCWQHQKLEIKEQNNSRTEINNSRTEINNLRTEINKIEYIIPEILKNIIEPYLESDIRFEQFLKILPKELSEYDIIKLEAKDNIEYFDKNEEILEYFDVPENKSFLDKIKRNIYGISEEIGDRFAEIYIKISISIDAYNLLTDITYNLYNKLILSKNIEELVLKLEEVAPIYFVRKTQFISKIISEVQNTNSFLQYVILDILDDISETIIDKSMYYVYDNTYNAIYYYDIIYIIDSNIEYTEMFNSENLPFKYFTSLSIFNDTEYKNPIINKYYMREFFNIFNIEISDIQLDFFRNFLYDNYINRNCKIDLPLYAFSLVSFTGLIGKTTYKEFTDAFLNLKILNDC